MAKKSQKQASTSFKILFKNRRGLTVTAISKAFTFQVTGPRGGIVIKNAIFPEVFKTASMKKDFVRQAVNKVVQQRQNIRVRRRILDLENRIARRERRAAYALERGKEKEAREIEDDVRDDVNLLREYVYGILDSSLIRRSESSQQVSFKLQKKIDVLKYTFLHEPMTLTEFNFSERINWLYPVLFKAAKAVFKLHGVRRYIFRLIYQDSKTEKNDTVLGFGTERVRIPTYKSLKMAVEDLLVYVDKKFTRRANGYFSRNLVGPRVYMVGFTIEVLTKEHKTSYDEYAELRKTRKKLTKKEKTRKELLRKELSRIRRLLKTKARLS